MKLCKKILRIATLAFIILMLTSGTVLAAYSYYATVQVQETGGNPYSYLPVIADIDNDHLADNGYISLTGLDTRILSESTELEHLVTDDKVLFVIPSVEANSTGNYRYTLGNSLQDDFPIITGVDGCITITDDDTLDGGAGGMDDFEFEWKGYIDTSSGSDKNLVYKEQAFRTYISDTDDITSLLGGCGVTEESYITGEETQESVYGVTWRAQTFTTTSSYSIAGVSIKIFRTLNPGTITASIRATSENLPTGIDLVSGTLDGDSITSSSPGAFYNITFDAPYALSDISKYSILLRATSGDVSNLIHWWSDVADAAYDGGTYCTSANSGVAWSLTATKDFMFKTLSPIWVTEEGIGSGIHTVKTIATGGGTDKLQIWVGDNDAAPTLRHEVDLNGGSIPPNDNDWTLIQNNVMPYMEYYKHTVSDTLIAWYQPVSMIIGTTLDDREGTDAGETGTAEEDGAITWGTNPADLSATIGSLISSSQPEIAPASEEGAIDIVPEGEIPDGGVVNTAKLQDNPLYPVVEIISEYTDYTDEQIWFIGATIIILIGMGIAVVKVPNHLLLAGAVGLVLGGFFTTMEIYQWWMMLIFGFMFIMSILMERKPVL